MNFRNRNDVHNSHNVLIPRKDWQDAEFMNTMFKWDSRYPNFRPAEIASKGNGDLLLNYKAMAALQKLRDFWKAPLRVTSGYRDPEYNKRVRGAANSYHLQGRAFDIHMPRSWTGKHTASLIFWATHAGFSGIGLYTTFIHLDMGTHRTWEQGDTNLDPNDFNDPDELAIS